MAVLYVVFLMVLFAWSATGHVAMRVNLTHVDSARGYTKHELLRRMAARTRARVDKRWSPPARGHAVSASVSYDKDDVNYEYLIHFSIGTPRPQRVALTLDTSSDLVWTQCAACAVCFRQPLPALDSSASDTHRGVSCFDPLCAPRGGLPFSGCTFKDNLCFYAYSYPGSNSVTAGKMYEDTFTFGDGDGGDQVAGLRFGCGMYNKGNFRSDESGVAGLGRGPMSLPSQLKVGRFSHCFTTFGDHRSSPMFLGKPDNLEAQATGPVKSTPFAPGPPDSSLYYLSLKGVTVGKTRLLFDASTFALRADGTGGTIIESGMGITTFPQAVYLALREEFKRQVPLPVLGASIDGADVLCFSTSTPEQNKSATAVAVPKLIFNLEGADWDLPKKNYMLDFVADFGTGMCVVISSSGDSNMTIIGNFQQQNMHVEYDLDSNKLGFVPARCDKL